MTHEMIKNHKEMKFKHEQQQKHNVNNITSPSFKSN